MIAGRRGHGQGHGRGHDLRMRCVKTTVGLIEYDVRKDGEKEGERNN